MIVKIFGLFCLLCLVRGQGSPCCTKSSKFEVMEGFSIGSSQHGHGSYTEGGAKVSYDADKKMVNSYVGMKVNDKLVRLRVLQDYNQGIQYVIDEAKKCTKSNLTEPFKQPCVPAGSELVVHQYYGEASSNFYVDTYKVPDPMPNLQGYVEVSSPGCIPVAESFHGALAKESAGVVGVGFGNFTNGIVDPSVFVVPSQCASDAVYVKYGHEGLMRKRLFY